MARDAANDRPDSTARRVSEAGLAFIKAHEGFRARPLQLADGRWLIGHSSIDDAHDDREITLEEADERLRADLATIEDAIGALVFAPLAQRQLDALVSLGFSIGLTAFRASGVIEALNDGRQIDAAAVFDDDLRGRSGGPPRPVDALVRRRAAEKAMFLELDSGPVPAPSALLRPQLRAAESGPEIAAGLSADEDDLAAAVAPPEVLARLSSILPDAAAARPHAGPDHVERIRGERGPAPADARMRARPASPFPPAPYPLRRGMTSPGRVALAPAPTALRTPRRRRAWASAFGSAADEWGAQWPWIMGGVGLALIAVGAANVHAALVAPSSNGAGAVWVLVTIAGALAATAGGYYAARRLIGVEDARDPIP
jgi:GH24 family phage-related lysozyme (muramidase)